MSKQKNAIAVRTIGIDTGKNTLHMIGLDQRGEVVLREKVSRNRIAARLVNVPPCLIGIEAGMATHYMARELVALGHLVKQVRQLFPSRFGRTTRMTSGTPTPLRRLYNALRHAAFR